MERTYVKIDLDAIRHNVILAKQKANTKVYAIIKADAYGHGAIEVAHALEDIVYGFGLAIPEEAIQLRKAKIQKPLLILGNIVEDRLKDVLRYDLTPSVSNYSTAEKLSKLAVRYSKILNIHIGVDTGMGRIGFLEEEREEILKISKLQNIRIQGLCTHFASADETDKNYANEQIRKFNKFISYLKENEINIEIKHISNSAGIIEFDDMNFDAVRAGIMIYGLNPSKETNQQFGLKPALSWYATISHVKELPAGCGISYGSTFVTKEKTKVATIPIGYADGYPRSLSNKGYILINGKFAKILGRVCMDQFMVDVTNIDNVEVGTLATIIGVDGDKKISVEDIADLAFSFNYEFVCKVGLRVPRVYFSNGKFSKQINYIESITKSSM